MAKSRKTVMLFDLRSTGHHPSYIAHLVRYCRQYENEFYFKFVISPTFTVQHPNIVDSVQQDEDNNVEFVEINHSEFHSLKPISHKISRGVRYAQEWGLFCHYTKKLSAHHAVLMYLDTYRFPILLTSGPSCSFSAIYFRPSFHYSKFNDQRLSWKKSISTIQEKWLFETLLKKPKLDKVFCLDPFVVDEIKKTTRSADVIALPDPVELELTSFNLKNMMSVREDLGVEEGRTLFLLFGLLDSRKGIFKLLESLHFLPSCHCEKICLALVGHLVPEEKILIENQINKLIDKTLVQVVQKYEYIPEDNVQAYFHAADVVLAPYQRHVGMSGILIQAAAAQKPVLSSNYGLMGELVRRYSLGKAIDSTNPIDIASGLSSFLIDTNSNTYDIALMQEFAQSNSAVSFAKTLFDGIKASFHG